MASSETAIANLLYRYAELIDSGDFESAAALFRHCRVISHQGEATVGEGAAMLLGIWREKVIVYPDGTPRTKHVITNPIIAVDEVAGTATCRSYYTVLQQVARNTIAPVICGRYHDGFERVDGQWRFCLRDYSLTDLPGDLSAHLRGWAAS